MRAAESSARSAARSSSGSPRLRAQAGSESATGSRSGSRACGPGFLATFACPAPLCWLRLPSTVRAWHFTVLAVVCITLPANAADPRGTLDERLTERVARLGNQPDGVLPLLELWSHWEDSDPRAIKAALEKLAKDKRLSPARRVFVETLLADARARFGDPEALGKPFEDL